MRRFLSLLLLALAAGVPAFAQQQEGRIEHILKPDLSTAYDLRKSAFGTDLKTDTKGATVKAFTGEKTFSTKAFDAKNFAGTQEAWMAHSKYATKEAPVKKYDVPALDKGTATKTVAVAEAREVGKTADTRPSAEARQPQGSTTRFLNLNGAPTNTSELSYEGELKPLTLEEIRKLLNKNK